jgi:hypothetical protein
MVWTRYLPYPATAQRGNIGVDECLALLASSADRCHALSLKTDCRQYSRVQRALSGHWH